MKPDWDKLMAWYEEDETNNRVLIADIDCEGDGKDLCEEKDVQGFPTIKYGDPNNLERYDGDRDYDSLKAFAKANLEPKCGPSELHLCDADQLKEIDELMAMSDKDLANKIKEKEDAIAAVDREVEEFIKSLQSKYDQATKETDALKEEIKASKLRLLKSVRKYKEDEWFSDF